MTISNNYPAIKPTLSLDFANVEALDPRITFSRPTTATYYDGKTVALAEQNLFIQSSNLAASNWGIEATGTALPPVKTANYGVAPDGTSTAARYEFSLNGGTSTTDFCSVRQGYTTGVATPVTYSVWIKSTDGTSTYNALIISPDGSGSAVSITGTWTRFTVTATSLATVVSYGIRLRGGQTPTNSNTADILVWGAQLEQRSSVTAYTPTTTAPITNYIPALQTAPSNVARFEHNPITGESLGLEIEEQRTNLLLRSEEFDNAAWTTFNTTVTANNTVAPDGTITADKLVEDTSNNYHSLVQTTNPRPLSNPTISVYAKASGRNWLFLNLLPSSPNDFINDAKAYFDLSNGTIGTVTRGTANIVSVGNGWYRCSLAASQLTSTASTRVSSVIHVAFADGTYYYTGNGWDGIYIWGAQLEAGSFATSYIPTVASQVTRSADTASMTGTNFSSWYRPDEGTFYVNGSGVPNGSFLSAVNIGGTAYSAVIDQQATTIRGLSRTVGVQQASLSRLALPQNLHKAAFCYKLNDFALSVDGSISSTASGQVYLDPNLSLSIGRYTSAGHLNGTIKKIAYYPLRLTNTQLQALTES